MQIGQLFKKPALPNLPDLPDLSQKHLKLIEMTQVKLPRTIGCSQNGLKKLKDAQKKKSLEIGCSFSQKKISEQCCFLPESSVVKRFFGGEKIFRDNAMAILECLGLEDDILDILDLSEVNERNCQNIDDIDNLKTVLMELNYDAQWTQFSNWREKRYKTGAFIIKGKSGRGQRWLVNRLLEKKFKQIYDLDKLIPIMKPTPSEQSQKTYEEPDIERIWGELGRNLGNDAKTAEECVEKAFKRWENENLIIAVYTDRIYAEIPKFIQEFWQPLAQKVSSSNDTKSKSYLLMFLIDSSDRASQWNIETVTPDDLTNWHPQKLISLPSIEKLVDQVLYNWFEDYHRLLGFSQNDLENVSRTIFQKTNGIPELAFHKICESCGYKWSDIEKTLKL